MTFSGRLRSLSIVACAASALLALPAAMPVHAQAKTHAKARSHRLVSMYGSNNLWSGVVNTGRGYSAVSVIVTAPRVSKACGATSEVAAWVGLGGYGQVPFTQNGLTFTPSGFGAWYEVFDRNGRGPEVNIPLPYKAGDRIRIAERFSANHRVVRFSWTNLTRHTAPVVRNVSGASKYYSGRSAEWVVERSSINPLVPHPNLVRHSPIVFDRARSYRGSHRYAAAPAGVLLSLAGDTGRYLNAPSVTSKTSIRSVWKACR